MEERDKALTICSQPARDGALETATTSAEMCHARVALCRLGGGKLEIAAFRGVAHEPLDRL